MSHHAQTIRAQFVRLYGQALKPGSERHDQFLKDRSWLRGFSNLVAAKLRERQSRSCPLPPGVVVDDVRRRNAESLEAWAHRYNHHRRTGEVPPIPVYEAPAVRGRRLSMSEV